MSAIEQSCKQMEKFGGGFSKMSLWLDNAEEVVKSCDADEAKDVLEKAGIIRKFVDAARAAGEIRAKAVRVELRCLRKLAFFGYKGESPQMKACIRRLLEMTDEEFEHVVESAKEHGSPSSIVREAVRAKENLEWEKSEKARLAKYLAGNAGRAEEIGAREAAREAFELKCSNAEVVSGAVCELLKYMGESDATTVSGGAAKLAEILGMEYYSEDAIVRSGLTHVVREAIRKGANHSESVAFFVSKGGSVGRVPPFVTFYDGDNDVAWVHVPCYKASVGQLRFMAEMRRKQAEEAARVAGELEVALAVAEEVQAIYPNVVPVTELLALAKKKKMIEYDYSRSADK